MAAVPGGQKVARQQQQKPGQNGCGDISLLFMWEIHWSDLRESMQQSRAVLGGFAFPLKQFSVEVSPEAQSTQQLLWGQEAAPAHQGRVPVGFQCKEGAKAAARRQSWAPELRGCCSRNHPPVSGEALESLAILGCPAEVLRLLCPGQGLVWDFCPHHLALSAAVRFPQQSLQAGR